MDHDPSKYRIKPTAIDRTLPGISTWPQEKLRRYRYTNLDGQHQFIQPSDYAANDPHPLPMPIDREGYLKEENSDRYWASGLADWLNVMDAMHRFGNRLAEDSTVLDFGCASGRFLRHAAFQSDSTIEVHGCDLAPANIDWMRQHFPPEIQTHITSNEPELPFDNATFDLVTAFSVFTHIDQNEEQWLLELKRITKKRGLLYITVHNEASWNRVADRPATLRQFEHQNSFKDNLQVTQQMIAEPLPAERIVFRKDYEKVYNCNVWHSNAYVREYWGRHFEILHIAGNGHSNFQSPVIMRPK